MSTYTKHGHATGGKVTRTYNIYQHMVRRCYDTRSQNYRYYGAKGIAVCARWLGRDGFSNFLADMGEAPTGMTIERRKNRLGYSFENCVWATMKVQNNNKTTNRRIRFRGQVKTLAQWAESTGVSYSALLRRLDVYGWTIERALTTPMVRDAADTLTVPYKGGEYTVSQLAKLLGLNRTTLLERLRRGWSVKKATTPIVRYNSRFHG